MSTPYVDTSKKIEERVMKIFNELGFNSCIQDGEKLAIVGSFKYGLLVAGDSRMDMDVWITTPDPRKYFQDKLTFFTKIMARHKLVKKMNVNNLYDEYKEFDQQKAELLQQEEPKFFMIELVYYFDETLTDKIIFEFHIAHEDHPEKFTELLSLKDEDKENLLELKYYVYHEFPFFWNRSFLVYSGFLAGNRTKEQMLTYLKGQGFERLIKQ